MAYTLKKTLNIRQRLEWTIFFIIVVICSIASILSLNFDTERAVATERARLEIAAKIFASDTDLTFQAINRTLSGVILTQLVPFDKINKPGLLSNLKTISNAIPGVRAINVIDSNAIVIAGYPYNLVGQSFPRRYFYTAPKAAPDKTVLYISAPFRSILNNNAVSVTRMIPDNNGKFNGAVSVILDPAYFGERIKTVVFADDVKTWIGDSENNIFVKAESSSDDFSLQKSSVISFLLFNLLKPIEVQRSMIPSGPNNQHNLFIGISRNPNAVIAPLMQKAKLFILFFVTITAVCAVLLFFFQLRRQKILEERRQSRFVQEQADALRLSEARFRAMIEEAPVAVAILRGGQFLYSNLRYNTLHGYASDEDLTGLPWTSSITAQSLNNLNAEIGKITSDSPEELYFEAQGIGFNGNIIFILASTARITLADGAVTFVYIQDISAQKRAEALVLEARDAAQAANMSKAEFLANMSHEIRTPLNAILGFVYLLTQSGLGHDVDSTLNKIRNAGRSLLGIINDVLDMSKIDAGAMTIEDASLNLQEVIDNVAAIMGATANDKPVQLLIHPLPPGILKIKGDALRIEQLLVNLANNAIKFTLQGQVEVKVSIEQLADKNTVLHFSVTDTGIGIPISIQEKIFTPFTQADSSTTRKFGGSGLGLAICKKLVELMGGEIGLSSTPGSGSEFWFTIPLESLADNDSSCYSNISLNAIISSSHESLLNNLGATGNELGWKIILENSPQSALMKLIEINESKCNSDVTSPEILFLDWEKNGNDCLAVVRAIRKIAPLDRYPVVILTSTNVNTGEQEKLETIIDALLIKPVTVSTLNNAAIAALRKRSQAKSYSPNVLIRTELSGIRILVVDDSEINRDVAQRILQDKGARVDLAEDGQRAITWLLAHPDTVDVVLMDLQMPVMDGIEATRQLRKMEKFVNLPIVALTAGAFKFHHDAALEVGMTDFVTKPFDIPMTINLIQRLANKSIPNPFDNQIVTEACTARETSDMLSPFLTLDLQRGIEIWGDIDTYYLYLHKFVESFSSSAINIRTYACSGDVAGATSIAHKLAGAAASVALMSLAKMALNAEKYFFENTEESYDQSLVFDNLDLALRDALAEIAGMCTL